MDRFPQVEYGSQPYPRVMNHPHDNMTGICCICAYVGHQSVNCPLRNQYKYSLNKHYTKPKKIKLFPVNESNGIHVEKL